MAGADAPLSSLAIMKDDNTSLAASSTSQSSAVVDENTKFEQDGQEVDIVDRINELILGEKTSLLDAPFVLDEGQSQTSWTPSVCSTSSGGLFTSPTESSRLFSVPSSGSSRFSNYAMPCALEEISIWRNLNGTKQVCAQSMGGTIPDSVSLQSLDPSFSRYGSIHDVVARAECPFIRVQLPVVPKQSDGHLEDIGSVISILANNNTSVRSLAEIYRQGVLYSSCELSLEQEGSRYTDETLFSTKLPQDFLRVYRDEGGPDNAMDDVLLLQFTQQSSGAEQNRFYDTLIVLCEFRPEADASETGTKLSVISSVIPEDRPSSTRSSDGEHSTPNSPGWSKRQRSASQANAKLRVTIPPTVRNVIHIYSETPASGVPPSNPLSTSSMSHSNPLLELPQSPLPMTPQDPSLNSPAGDNKISATHTTGFYPFTLSTSSPGVVLSPAFGVLDPESISPAGGSAPAWNTFGSPLAPPQFPRSAMYPKTRRPADDIGASDFPPSPDEGTHRFLVPHISYPDSPSIYSCASYRSPI